MNINFVPFVILYANIRLKETQQLDHYAMS